MQIIIAVSHDFHSDANI